MKQEINSEKKLTILAVTVLTVAFLICLAWEFFCHTPYYAYSEGAKASFSAFLRIHYEKQAGEFTYKVYPPAFLHDNAYISLNWGTFTVRTDYEGNIIPSDTPDLSLFIWPSVFKEPTYGLMIGCDGTFEQSMITYTKNNDGSYNITHKFESEKTIELFNEYKGVIEAMLDFSEATWDFNGYYDIIDGIKAKNK